MCYLNLPFPRNNVRLKHMLFKGLGAFKGLGRWPSTVSQCGSLILILNYSGLHIFKNIYTEKNFDESSSYFKTIFYLLEDNE